MYERRILATKKKIYILVNTQIMYIRKKENKGKVFGVFIEQLDVYYNFEILELEI